MVARQINRSESESSESNSAKASITAFFGPKARSFRSDYSSPHTTIITTSHDVFIKSANDEIGKGGKICVSSNFICPILQMIPVDSVIMNKNIV